jgi:hypothetical protein
MNHENIKYPEWWPENPYPESVFPMTLEEYEKAIPDENLRTAISGCLGRVFFDLVSAQIYRAYEETL